MDNFLAAQADDPFDPAPMLIQADWLEEQGDATGAAVLRGLPGAGMPSIAALALGEALCSFSRMPDVFEYGSGFGSGDGHGGEHGQGDGHGEEVGDGDVGIRSLGVQAGAHSIPPRS